MNTTANCSEGYTFDNFLRFAMPIGPFNEPPGMDCYLHLSSFFALAWMQFVITLLCITVVLLDLPRKKGFLLKFISFTMLCFFGTTLIVVLSCLYFPIAVKGAYSSGVIIFFICVFVYFVKLVSTKLLMLKGFTNSESSLEILGGARMVLPLVFCLFVSFVATLVGCAGFTLLYDVHDESVALIYWQLHCVGIVCGCLGLVVSVNCLASKFILILQTSLDALPLQAPIPKGQKNSRAQMEDLIVRFNMAKKGPTVLLLPTFVIVLHAFVLPMFSYLILLQAFNSNLALMTVWYTLTSTGQKQRFNLFFRKGRKEGTTSGFVSQEQPKTLALVTPSE